MDKIKMFTERILPLCYDNTLTQYEIMCKINYKINEIIDAITTGSGVKAEQLKTPRRIDLKKNVLGGEFFDGSKNIMIDNYLNNSCLISGEGWYRVAYCEDINTIKKANTIMVYQTLNTKKFGLVKINIHHKQPMADIDFTNPQIIVDDFEIIAPIDVIKEDFKLVYWINPCTNKTECTFYYNSSSPEVTIFTELQNDRKDYSKGYVLEVAPKETYDNFKGTELMPYLNFIINSIELKGDIEGKKLIDNKNVIIDTKISQKKLDEINEMVLDNIKEGEKIKIDRTEKTITINSEVKEYNLPIATSEFLGGVKIGNNINIDEEGKISTHDKYVLPKASKEVLGGIKLGDNQIDADGNLIIPINNYTLPISSKEVLGGIKVGKNLTIESDGTLNAEGGGGEGGEFEIPIATREKLGGVMPQEGFNLYPDGTIKIKKGSDEELGGCKSGTNVKIDYNGVLQLGDNLKIGLNNKPAEPPINRKPGISVGRDNYNSSGNTVVIGTDNNVSQGIGGGNTLIVGNSCQLTGAKNSISIGSFNKSVNNENTLSCGEFNESLAKNSTTLGLGCQSGIRNELVMGSYNKISNETGDNPNHSIFTIGNGKSDSERSNNFSVNRDDGTVTASGSYVNTGADYAEFFEMENIENFNNIIGKFVTINNDKIRIAKRGEYILGVVSKNSSIIGNGDNDDWNKRYLKTIYGEKIIGEDGFPLQNPLYNSDIEYRPRRIREEWQTVGLLGRLIVHDNGLCKVNNFCNSNNEGIAEPSINGYIVLKRINNNTIEILFK